METQVRRYEIREGQLDEFVKRWHESVVPLRRSYGFRFDGAWCLEETSEFVWVISYDGEGSLEDADARYYTSVERKDLDPDPAELIVAVDHAHATRVI